MTYSEALLAANNITSLVIVIACWWLAHQYARALPPGRMIAAGFSVLGLSVLATAFLRNMGLSVDWLVVCSKGLIGLVLALMAYRRHVLERRIRAGAICGACMALPPQSAGPGDVS